MHRTSTTSFLPPWVLYNITNAYGSCIISSSLQTPSSDRFFSNPLFTQISAEKLLLPLTSSLLYKERSKTKHSVSESWKNLGCGSLSYREEEGAKISWTPKAKQFRVAFINIEFLQLFIFAVGSFSDIFYLCIILE